MITEGDNNGPDPASYIDLRGPAAMKPGFEFALGKYALLVVAEFYLSTVRVSGERQVHTESSRFAKDDGVMSKKDLQLIRV